MKTLINNNQLCKFSVKSIVNTVLFRSDVNKLIDTFKRENILIYDVTTLNNDMLKVSIDFKYNKNNDKIYNKFINMYHLMLAIAEMERSIDSREELKNLYI